MQVVTFPQYLSATFPPLWRTSEGTLQFISPKVQKERWRPFLRCDIVQVSAKLFSFSARRQTGWMRSSFRFTFDFGEDVSLVDETHCAQRAAAAFCKTRISTASEASITVVHMKWPHEPSERWSAERDWRPRWRNNDGSVGRLFSSLEDTEFLLTWACFKQLFRQMLRLIVSSILKHLICRLQSSPLQEAITQIAIIITVAH